MNLLRGALAQRLGAVTFDLALSHGPRLADEPRLETPLLHLTAQRRRRQSESDCRLSEGEHLLGDEEDLRPRRLLGVRVPALNVEDAGPEGCCPSATGSEFIRRDVLDAICCGWIRALRVLHGQNVSDTAYVVKGQS
jgi:hypothetical protein